MVLSTPVSNSQTNHHFGEGQTTINAFDDQISTDSYSTMSRGFIENNPGSFEDIQKELKELSPQPIDGFKLLTNMPLNESSQASLNWSYTSDGNSKFHPALNFAAAFPWRRNDRNLVGLIEIHEQKNVAISLCNLISPRFRLKIQGQGNLQKIENSEISTQYLGDSYSLAVSLIDPSITQKTSLLVLQYLHRLTKNVDAGFEAVLPLPKFQLQDIIPTGVIRFRHGQVSTEKKSPYAFGDFGSIDPKGTFLATINPRSAHLSYVRRVVPGFQLFTSYDFTNQSQMPHVSAFGYNYSLSKQDITLRSSFDTTNTIQTVFEKAFQAGDSGWSFTISVAHNFNVNKTITGFGLALGK